jgi:hypothetical protein
LLNMNADPAQKENRRTPPGRYPVEVPFVK